MIAIGPIPMMKAVSNLTKPYGIKTIISMNTIMWTAPACAADAA